MKIYIKEKTKYKAQKYEICNEKSNYLTPPKFIYDKEINTCFKEPILHTHRSVVK